MAESEKDKETMEEERGVYKLVIEDLKIELADVKEAFKKAQKGKAGKSSALMRMKRKFSEIDDSDEDHEHEPGCQRNKSSQTNVKLAEEDELLVVVSDTSFKFRNLEVLNGK